MIWMPEAPADPQRVTKATVDSSAVIKVQITSGIVDFMSVGLFERKAPLDCRGTLSTKKNIHAYRLQMHARMLRHVKDK